MAGMTALAGLASVLSGSAGTIASLAATGISALGSIVSGNQAKADANFQAAQLKQQGDAEFASSQREQIRVKRERDFLLSRQQVVAAGSGLGALDDTVIDLAGDIYQESQYKSDIVSYQGEEAKKGRDTQAASALLQGQQRRQSALFEAGGTILGGIGKYASRRNDASLRTSQLSSASGSTSRRYG